MQRKNFPPKHVDPLNYHVEEEEEEEEDEEEEFDLIEAMNEMTVHERRKVYALKGLLNDYKRVRAKFREELALLQVGFMKSAQSLRDVRSEIVRGVRDITEDELARVKAAATTTSGVREIPSDEEDKTAGAAGESTEEGKEVKATKSVRVVAPQETGRLETAAANPNGGIPDFWLTAMCNTEVFDSMITERDRHALSFLQDITLEYVEGDPQKGAQLNFIFAPNEYFTNTVLSKTFHMSFNEDTGEVEIDTLKSTPIEWTSPEKNLTIVIKSKKQRHKSSKSIRVVKREEKCPSFFDFFTDPFGEDDDDTDENEDEEEDEKAELQIEAGQLLMEELVPKAAFFYTGKSVEQTARQLQSQLDFQMFAGGDDEEDDDDDDNDDDDDAAGAEGARLIQQRGVQRGRGGAGKQQECKQQ
ncbi:Nucleosome assembly protein (NAP) [Trypanosoma melophagium]|uniref:Nucleosome assembly protein (NAP) n=1 Tax=Trypanosoma melophagium TaxID=715481 RepID=UPI00351A3121|nr:Nucleosome assembly protein (NAP) [Trypanosoma melophagium]